MSFFDVLEDGVSMTEVVGVNSGLIIESPKKGCYLQSTQRHRFYFVAVAIVKGTQRTYSLKWPITQCYVFLWWFPIYPTITF